MDDIHKLEPLFGSWYIDRPIGKGSFGKVYAIKKTDFGKEYFSALKVVSIPQNSSEIDGMRSEGMDDKSINDEFWQIVKEVVSEFELMAQFRGNSNVVSYEDHLVLPQSSGFGYDILIRMELLTNLAGELKETKFSKKDVIQLGIDMCKALELCQKYNIIHRDIKPENIFRSKHGDFKLGDFGIARTVEKTVGDMSKKGTYTYMAPEVYKGEVYGSSVDIYSLGVVLYRLLNENRTPFLPPQPENITHSYRESALMRRMSGEKIPYPCDAEGRLAEIVMKAMEYDPRQRFSSALQMRAELEAILYTETEGHIIYPKGDDLELPSNHYADDAELETVELPDAVDDIDKTTADLGQTIYIRDPSKEQPENPPQKKKFVLAAIIGGVLFVALIVFMIKSFTSGNGNPDETESTDTEKTDISDGNKNNNSSGVYKKGTVTQTGFSSEYLDLSFTASALYVMATNDELDGMIDFAGDIMYADADKKILDYAKANTLYEMMVTSMDSTHNIILVVEKLEMANLTEEQYIEALKLQFSPDEYHFADEVTSISIAGRNYTMITADTEDYSQYFCVRKINDRMLTFIVLLLTSYEQPEIIINASKRAFACGYIFKSQCQTLADTIYKTASTHTPQEQFIKELLLSELTSAERSVLNELLQEKADAQSPSSFKTIANQKTSIFKKLGLKNTNELIRIFRNW